MNLDGPVWQVSDRYPWAVWFQTSSSVWFIVSDESGLRGSRRMAVLLEWQAAQGSLPWPGGLRVQAR